MQWTEKRVQISIGRTELNQAILTQKTMLTPVVHEQQIGFMPHFKICNKPLDVLG